MCIRDRYKARHGGENGFVDAKQFRGIATRYCKLVRMYEALWCGCMRLC